MTSTCWCTSTACRCRRLAASTIHREQTPSSDPASSSSAVEPLHCNAQMPFCAARCETKGPSEPLATHPPHPDGAVIRARGGEAPRGTQANGEHPVELRGLAEHAPFGEAREIVLALDSFDLRAPQVAPAVEAAGEQHNVASAAHRLGVDAVRGDGGHVQRHHPVLQLEPLAHGGVAHVPDADMAVLAPDAAHLASAEPAEDSSPGIATLHDFFPSGVPALLVLQRSQQV
eukprot:CAMPEP_0182815012 /NCGR_PEP_ID=MMETSP0006_2-20121128/10163_1 /TAXON_ID=97485 /ORGANISM="Prymnesium parvum, Strain Texoma1" /LENGTH=229 /DNA_ID=CAMNT_0024941181 /DNA_START=592 /DNA_END=1282 /DNA_ORIENTATION=-